jgi:S-adenosylmethionine:tRNA ribosyltransferase-isomerase
MKLSDFTFDLPAELIARRPLPERSSSRLLCVDGKQQQLVHRQFNQIVDLIEPGDLLVFNDTKVIPARLFGRKQTGGQVEMLVERILDRERFLAQVRVSKPPRLGDMIVMSDDVSFEFVGRKDQFYEFRYSSSHPESPHCHPESPHCHPESPHCHPESPHCHPERSEGSSSDDKILRCAQNDNNHKSVLDVIESLGEIPLPPYMHREPDESDKERYQTVYARYKGSVAAPTAGLHFDDALLQALQEKNVQMGYLTLHIGAGTFSPVRVENILEHQMHSEYYEISPELCAQIVQTKARGNRVICVGTTSLRALESACQGGVIAPYSGETNIFIYPGYQFRCADALITNLHLPESTLLMLVCAFGGQGLVMHAYREAVAAAYRFYSYGDAMFVVRATAPN